MINLHKVIVYILLFSVLIVMDRYQWRIWNSRAEIKKKKSLRFQCVNFRRNNFWKYINRAPLHLNYGLKNLSNRSLFTWITARLGKWQLVRQNQLDVELKTNRYNTDKLGPNSLNIIQLKVSASLPLQHNKIETINNNIIK